jgi:DNA-binding response OmpR family regulator
VSITTSLGTNVSTSYRKPIKWQHDRRTIQVDERIIEFTRTEYQLLYPLHAGKAVTYENLAISVYGCQIDQKVRTMMDKHIDRIRGKLYGSGVYIYCVLGYGYMLLSEIDGE